MVRDKDIQSERDLVRVGRKAFDDYKDATLTSLTAYSLYWLHQWQLARTIEAIAILNWRLFPEKFSMVVFPEYPDAFRTNRSLLQMQPKYRNLLTGAASKGFSLNARGIGIATALASQLGPPKTEEGQALGSTPRVVRAPVNIDRPRSLEPERGIARLRSSKLYEKWSSGTMTERDLIPVPALLGIFDHTPGTVRQRAMKQLERNAQQLDDRDAERFLGDVRRAFPQALIR